MAPSRKRGAKKKGPAAASSRRQWKVGDLVLAKVKGFPAWPATVSEPEKWGYSSDGKKVLVYFFGTQQIALCNPADVEAFTEEKKQSLAKRQGKGADFVRAVREIIACFEKSKRETQVNEVCSSGEDVDVVVSNRVDPSTNLDQTDAPLTLNSQNKSSYSVTDRHEHNFAVEGGSAVGPRDESCNKEASFGDPTDAAVIASVNSPLLVTYSYPKRYEDLHQEACVITHRRKSRKSLRVQDQNFVVPCSDNGNTAGNISADAAHNVPVRSTKCIKKSPDLFGSDDADSSVLASNVSMEDNDSEVNPVDSDASDLHEGTKMDSIFKLDTKTIHYPEGDIELSKGPDLETKAVFNKKKRKPNRNRASDDSATPTIQPEEEAGSQIANQGLHSPCRTSTKKCFEPDWDELLPLSKRARVRMGQSSTEKRYKGDTTNSPQQIKISSNGENGSLPDGFASALDRVNISFPKSFAPYSESVYQTCKGKKEKMFDYSKDGEAALPPSKRIHRALEAMSANVAEEGQACKESSSSVMTSGGRHCISSIDKVPSMTTINSKGGNDIELQELDSCAGDCSHNSVCSFSTSSNPMISTENNLSSEVDEQLTKCQSYVTGKVNITDARDQVDEDLSDSVVYPTAKSNSQIQLHGKMFPNLVVKCCEVGSNQDSPSPSLPPIDNGNIRIVDNSNASDTSELNGINLDTVTGLNESGKLMLQNCINVCQNKVICEDAQYLKQSIDDSSIIKHMHEAVKGVKITGEDDRNSTSISNDCSSEKGTLGIRSSQSLTDGGGCLPQGSPPNTSVCNVSTSDSSNILQNGSCSPDVHQKNTFSGHFDGWKDGSVANQQSRLTGKSTDAGNAALLYFDATIGTLTRTKESIGRATQIAIDCAKFGIAAKVMEILVHSLESESSLHGRVDLFFLVDSILKGDVGGAYPSAMLAVLPRLLSAAAPPGHSAQENRRQCLKVLKLWLERRILPDSIIRHHIRELDTYRSLVGVYSRRTLRTERPLDDPVREMEGMLVNEYGSNSSFQLPGFCMPQMLKDEDEGSDSDGENFEAVTPEHDSELHEVPEMAHAIEKHRHVLEDVDGELEMEDVAPSFDVELNSISNEDGGYSSQVEKNLHQPFVPPLQQEVRLSSPPPQSSPSPPPPPLPLPPPPHILDSMSTTSGSYHAAVDSEVFADSQTVKDNTLHSMAEPRHFQPISDAVHCQVPERRDMHMQIPPPPQNFQCSDGATFENKGYSLRPPQPVPSNQFSFIQGEHVRPHREAPPTPSYSNRHHFLQNMKRENFTNNHERSRPLPYDCRERRDSPMPYSGPCYHDRGYHDRGVPTPYGYHPSESTRLPGHRWRFPPQSMNHWDSMPPFRPPYEDTVPVASRGPSYWRPM